MSGPAEKGSDSRREEEGVPSEVRQRRSNEEDAPLSAGPLVIGGLYEHYKGKQYRVHGVVRHSETLEELIYYECLYDNDLGKMWVRPKEMFLGNIEIKGEIRPRFRFISK